MTEKRKKVLLAQNIHPDAEMLLKEHFDTILSPGFDEQTVCSLIEDVDGLVIRSRTFIGAETLDKAAKLRVIGRTGVGVENIDIDAATRHGIVVINTPGANAVSVAEHAMALIIALVKHLPSMDREARRSNFEERYSYRAADLGGKTLGIVGAGNIGIALAKISRGFDMNILYSDICPNKVMECEYSGHRVTLDELLKLSDIISLHVPLMPETKHLMSEQKLALMKPHAILINTARGGIVDEKALITALQEKRIAAAGLDVFEKEPPDVSNPLFELDNVIVTPHTGAMTKESVRRMAMGAVQGVVDFLESRKPRFIYNPEALKKS